MATASSNISSSRTSSGTGSAFFFHLMFEVPVACSDWTTVQHSVFQLLGILLVVGFVAPANAGIYQALWMRVIVMAASVLTAFWAAVFKCWADVVGWNLALFAANGANVAYIIYLIMPPRLDKDVERMYKILFKPFNISQHQFKKLLGRGSDIQHLVPGSFYAKEGLTPVDQQCLGFLLSGRLRVTAEGVLLHYINSCQFIDSPEWESCTHGMGEIFQVTISADQVPCRYIQWPRKHMETLLKKDSFLKAVVNLIIGKDIMTKLYALNETEDMSVEDKLNRQASLNKAKTPENRRVPSLYRHKWERTTSDKKSKETPSPARKESDSNDDSDDSDDYSLHTPSQGQSTPSMKSALSMVDIRANIAGTISSSRPTSYVYPESPVFLKRESSNRSQKNSSKSLRPKLDTPEYETTI